MFKTIPSPQEHVFSTVPGCTSDQIEMNIGIMSILAFIDDEQPTGEDLGLAQKELAYTLDRLLDGRRRAQDDFAIPFWCTEALGGCIIQLCDVPEECEGETLPIGDLSDSEIKSLTHEVGVPRPSAAKSDGRVVVWRGLNGVLAIERPWFSDISDSFVAYDQPVSLPVDYARAPAYPLLQLVDSDRAA